MSKGASKADVGLASVLQAIFFQSIEESVDFGLEQAETASKAASKMHIRNRDL
jgi:hypothetical protein